MCRLAYVFFVNNLLVFFVLKTFKSIATTVAARYGLQFWRHSREIDFSVTGSPSESLVRASATYKRRKDWSADLCISVRIFLLYNYCL